jgi:hypothetical protein
LTDDAGKRCDVTDREHRAFIWKRFHSANDLVRTMNDKCTFDNREIIISIEYMAI